VGLAGTTLCLVTLLLAGTLYGVPAGRAQGTAAVTVVGDAIPGSLTGRRGDAGRGRDVVFNRDRGNCAVCHVMPTPDKRSHGDVGPSLEGVAGRLSEGQLRLRLVDARRVNQRSIMPSYYRLDGLQRVAKAHAGKPVLSAEEIEDALAYLMTLR
jgi:L-cysteine S-thiosulfotransferase